MSVYILLPLASLIANSMVVAYVLALKQRDERVRRYLYFTLGVSIWSLNAILRWGEILPAWHVGLGRINTFILIVISFLFLSFTYALLEKKRDFIYYTFAAIALITGALTVSTHWIVADTFVRHYWGILADDGPFYLVVIAALIIPLNFYALILLVLAIRKAEDETHRMQYRLVFTGSALCLGFGLLFDIIFPNILGIKDFPALSNVLTSFQTLFTFYAITQHGFFAASVDTAAEELFANSREGIIILDKRGQITQINQSALAMLVLDEQPTQTHITALLPDYRHIQQNNLQEVEIKTQCDQCSVSLSRSPVIKSGQVLGEILLLRDISAIKQAQADLHHANAELEQRVENRTAELAQTIQAQLNLMETMRSSAAQFSSASNELNHFAELAQHTTVEIANSLQQVTQSVKDQSHFIQSTERSMEMMLQAVNGVAKGAQDQAQATSKADLITGQTLTTFKRVSDNASNVQSETNVAAEVARKGTQIIEQTIQGMQAIKAKVGQSSLKVQEMGQRSHQIAAILKTIKNISSQTNLLALNAAIEAARAGQHGKGFAVVADEVRKLAQSAAAAAGDINEIIKSIQQSVDEAVAAMDESDIEVENGVKLTNQSGNALFEILEAVEGVYNRAGKTVEYAQQMSAASNDLVDAIQTVSAVVEENMAATEEMAAGAQEVKTAIDTFSNISQQSLSAVERISESTEQMFVQVEAVSRASQSLAQTARELEEVTRAY